MTSERRLMRQKQAVARLTRELAFELSVLRRLQNRERDRPPADPRLADIGAVYAAALLRGGRS